LAQHIIIIVPNITAKIPVSYAKLWLPNTHTFGHYVDMQIHS